MPARKTLVPAYCHHKASGKAVVRINGKDHYLGDYGTEASRESYRRLIAALLTTGKAVEEEKERKVTVGELVAAYWSHLEQTGRYTKNGRETSERGWLRDALRPLCSLFASVPAAAFGPRALIEVRTWMIAHGGRGDQPLARTTINGRVRRIVQVFRWGVSMELVGAPVWQALQAVGGLRRGESSRVREANRVQPVSWEDVAATLQHLSDELAAMVRLQWLTGMRPGEVRTMRLREVDRCGPVWVYRPAIHKNEHHGLSCERMIGPRAQGVLKPFLATDPDVYLFSPREVERKRMRARREARVLPMWPSHENRLTDKPGARLGDCYTTHSYRRAIHRACKAAGVTAWSPNQLRHARATAVRKEYGLEAAQVTLGHATAEITQVYAERDRELALRVAMETG